MKLYRYDPLNYLKDTEDFRLSLNAAIEEDTGDGQLFTQALKNIVEVRGWDTIASLTGMNVVELRNALSKSVSFETTLKVIQALGFKLQFS